MHSKITAWYCLLIGLLILTVWMVLLIIEEAPQISNELVAYIFGWISKFSTALLLILAGISMLVEWSSKRLLFYVALGFLINAANGAFWYYLANFNISFFAASIIIVVSAFYFAIINFADWVDVLYVTLGIVIYGSLNILGDAIGVRNWDNVVYIGPMLLFTILILLFTFQRDTI